MTAAEAVVRTAGEGEHRSFCGGGLMTFKATSEQTGGAFLLFEDRMTGGKVTPLHVHVGEDETFHVLEGELLIHIAGVERTQACIVPGRDAGATAKQQQLERTIVAVVSHGKWGCVSCHCDPYRT